MSRIAKVLIGLTFLLCLSACNTLAGAGQDMQDAGESIEDAAEG